MTATPRPLADRALFAATMALLVWLPLPWGSNRPWAAYLLVAAAASLLGLRLLLVAAGAVQQPRGTLRGLALPALWWLLWLGWIGLQLLPLDAGTLAGLSPEAARLYAESGALLSAAPQPRLSIAPSATVDAWLLSWGYFALYALIVLSCAGDSGRMRRTLGVLVISGLLQAVYGGLMVLSGIEWGFFAEKEHYRGVATGTFVNRNHLAGYLELTSAAALALVLSELGRPSGPRTLRQRLLGAIALAFSAKMRARLALVIMVIALVLTRSRMGNTAFFASLTVCGMGFILLRHRHYAFRAFLLFASVIAIDILVVSNWYGLERVIERIESTSVDREARVVFLEEAPRAVAAYRWTGAGLGAFADAFAPFRPAHMREYFDHAHNDYIELAIETGAVGMALLAVFVLAHALHALRVVLRRRRRTAAAVGFAALMSMTAFAIHATTDFNLQIPANAASLLALMALSAACPSASAERRRRSGRRTGRNDLDSTSPDGSIKGESS